MKTLHRILEAVAVLAFMLAVSGIESIATMILN